MARKFIYLFLSIIFAGFFAYKEWQNRAPSIKSGSQFINVSKDQSESFDILIVGDTGTGNENQNSVAKAMDWYCQNNKLDFVIMLGDNFYQSGVKSITDRQWETKWQDVYLTDCLKSKKFYPIFGNHDYKINPAVQIEYSKLDRVWSMPARFYKITLEDTADIIAMDTNINDICLFKGNEECSLSFFFEQSKKSKMPWKVVIGHHPATMAKAKHKAGFQGFWLRKFFCNGGIDAYYAGHSHHLEHREVDSCETDFFISGAGGGDLYYAEKDDQSKFLANELGFAVLSISKDQMKTVYYSNKREKLYEHVKSKGNI